MPNAATFTDYVVDQVCDPKEATAPLLVALQPQIDGSVNTAAQATQFDSVVRLDLQIVGGEARPGHLGGNG